MVFIFGFDVPVIEILLLATIVVLIAIAFLFYYMRKIIEYLIRMEYGLQQLERHLGIHAFQQMPGEHARVRLESYIVKLKEKGMSDKQIRAHLVNHGWEAMVVNAIMWKQKEEESGHGAHFVTGHQPHWTPREPME